MKKFVMPLTVLCTLALLLTGCLGSSSSSVSCIQLTDQEKMIGALAGGEAVGVLQFNFQDDIKGMVLTQETWYNGECKQVDILTYGGTSDINALCISMGQIMDEQGNMVGTEWQILCGFENGYSRIPVKVMFSEMQAEQSFGWSHAFLGQNNAQDTALKADEHYILAACCFNLSGNGLRGFDCETLTEQPETINENDCVVLLRMTTYATKEEADIKV